MTLRAIRRTPAVPAGGASPADPDGLAFLGAPDALDDLLRCADYLVLAASLTDATRGLIGERELGLMKPGAVLVNVARAERVDEDALYRALADRRIAGAILDVWYRYPQDRLHPVGPAPTEIAKPTWPSRHPFHELPNVLMTPHVSGWTEGMLEARATVIAGNVRRVVRGEPPVNLVARD